MRHVIAIDQGTTGTTAMVIGEDLTVVGRHNEEFRQIYPQPGWVEHDPNDIWQSVLTSIANAIEKARIDPASIAALGITNQRETSVLWERKTIRPVRNAIVWQDRRTASICEDLKGCDLEPEFTSRSGLILDPYFSGTKLRWILDEDRDRRSRAQRGELAFGTIDSFLVAKLTDGDKHVTDVTNASRTLLLNLQELQWDDVLLGHLDIPRELLAEVRASSEIVGETRSVDGLPDGIPIAGIAGDQHAALFGQACFSPGDTKCTYGTGAFLLMNTGNQPVSPQSGVLATCAWKLGAGDEAGEVCYALEGSAFIAGAAVQWLRDGLGLIASARDIEELANSVADTGGVVVVPAFAGLGAPHWRPDARGIITGLTRGTTRGHLARAVLEGVALQNYDIVKAMERDSGVTLSTFRVDGGASANNLLMQMQADVLGVDISRPAVIETTALGASFLAGLGVGLWSSKRDIAAIWREDQQFSPQRNRDDVQTQLHAWNAAVAKA